MALSPLLIKDEICPILKMKGNNSEKYRPRSEKERQKLSAVTAKSGRRVDESAEPEDIRQGKASAAGTYPKKRRKLPGK